MPNLQNVLAGSGYRDRRDQIERQEAALQSNAINQAGALQRIFQSQEAMRNTATDRATAEQDRQMLQSVMSQTGGNAEQAIAALLKAGTPKSIELASKLKGLLPEKPAQPQLVTVIGPDGKPMQRWVRPGEATGTDVGQKYVAPQQGKDTTPYYTFISTPEGIVAGDARKGTVAPVSVGGQRVMKAPDDPANRGRIAGAVATGEAQAKRAFNMDGIGAVIKRGEDILHGRDPKTGRPVQRPTASGVGSIYDTAAGFFGASPAGAKEAQALKAVAGALTAKMPRMEGPQSDRDVNLYREMAAEIGNDGLPLDRRIQALEDVKSLWAKYERLNPGAFVDGRTQGDAAPATPAPQGVDQADWDAMTPEERSLWQN